MDEITFEYFLENPRGWCLEKHVASKFPELYKKIKDLPGKKFSEKIYIYFKGPGKCVVCGRPTMFKSIVEGYCECCSPECAVKNPNRLVKIHNTCLERYGVTNPSQLEDIKKKKKNTFTSHYGDTSPIQLESTKNTIKERYGTENVSQLEDIKEKKKDTLTKHYGSYEVAKQEMYRSSAITKKERYGDSNYNNRPKAEMTCIERHGVSNPFNIPGVFEKGLNKRLSNDAYKKVAEKNIERSIEAHDDVIDNKGGIYVCKCPHPGCDKCGGTFEISVGQYHGRKQCGSELCTVLKPIGSTLESSQEQFIENILKKLLKEHNINFTKHDRKLLDGRELDFYIPSHNIAIECNGIYWHSEVYKTNNYHYKKFVDCMNKGVQLITIWEDQVRRQPEVIKNMILSKLGVYNVRLYARKCTIRECSKQDADAILANHVQGCGQSSIRIGLYYNNEIVSVMTFGKKRGCIGGTGTENEYELIRYCVKPGYQIVGGASKLMKYFISHFRPSKIVSFSSNDISTGELYKNLKFNRTSTSMSYWYIDKDWRRYHRYNFRKSELIRMGYDRSKTEKQITDEMGLHRIWDSGQTRWELVL